MPQPGSRNAPDAPPAALCVFGALCVFLSALEYLIPRPLPYMRLGLANLPLMLALFFNARDFALLVLLKTLLPALLFGTLFSYIFLFSFAGSAASALVMFALCRLAGPRLSFAGLGVAGAFASNAAQLVLARWLVLGKGAVYLAPAFLAAGILTGCALGVCANRFSASSRWYRAVRRGARLDLPPALLDAPPRRARVRAAALFCAGACLCAALSLVNDLRVLACALACLAALSLVLKKKNRWLFAALFMASIVACNLLVPFGKVLASWGHVRVSAGALREGARKALTIEALILLSRLCVSQHLRLPGRAGRAAGGACAVLALLRERPRRIRRGSAFADIDALLFEVCGPGPEAGSDGREGRV